VNGRAATRGALWRAASYVAGQGLSIVAAALLFRHLGVADAGRYVTVLALVAIVQGLADAGLNTLGTRELSVRPEAERGPLLARLLGLRLALTLAGLVVAVAFAAAAGYPSAMVAGTVIAGAALAVLSVQGTFGVLLVVKLRGDLLAVAELARQAAGLALVGVLVLAGAGLVAFFGAYAGAALVALAVTVAAIGRGALIVPTLQHTRGLARDVAPFAIAAMASVAFFRVAMLEMSLLASAHETGLFGASFRVVEALVAIPALAVGMVLPVMADRAARGDREGLAAAVERVVAWSALAGLIVAAVLAACAGVIVRVVAGPDFAAAGPILRIQGLALAASFLAAPWAYALLSLGRERAVAWANGVGVVLALGVAAALIEADGARGAALATVLGEAGLATAFGVLLAREGVPLGLRLGRRSRAAAR
jgi:O-antigen/teichoic acid export membrane protein